MPIKAAPVAPPLPSWTGFYVGGDVGGAWRAADTVTWVDPNFLLGVPGAVPSPLLLPTKSSSGFVGGFHAGYNWQFAPAWVLGVEGDFTWPNIREDSFLTPAIQPPGAANHTFLSASTRNNWLASVRARLGVVGWNTLWYVTGGAAWTEESYAGQGQFFNGFSDLASFHQTKAGWVAGGGAEYMINPNWLLRAEYLYYKFDSGGASGGLPYFGPTAFGVAAPTFTWGNNYNIQAVRVGASYKF